MKTLILSMFFSALLLSAADVTGKSAFLTLKQDGAKLTGTGGPAEDQQEGVLRGHADRNQLIFAVEKDCRAMTFKLEVDGESIKGEVRRENDEGPADVGLVSLKRVKA